MRLNPCRSSPIDRSSCIRPTDRPSRRLLLAAMGAGIASGGTYLSAPKLAFASFPAPIAYRGVDTLVISADFRNIPNGLLDQVMSRKTTTGIGIEILRNYFRDHKRENDFLILPRPEFEKNRRGDYLLIEIIVAGSIYLLTREEMKEITDKGIYGIGAVTALTQRPIWPNNIQPPFWETNLLPILLTQDAVALQARLRAALRQVLVPVGASILIANQVKK